MNPCGQTSEQRPVKQGTVVNRRMRHPTNAKMWNSKPVFLHHWKNVVCMGLSLTSEGLLGIRHTRYATEIEGSGFRTDTTACLSARNKTRKSETNVAPSLIFWIWMTESAVDLLVQFGRWDWSHATRFAPAQIVACLTRFKQYTAVIENMVVKNFRN